MEATVIAAMGLIGLGIPAIVLFIVGYLVYQADQHQQAP